MSTNAHNDHLVLVSGKSGTGKSASLMNLRNQPGVIYLNCEAGKRLPFANKFQSLTVTDPMEVFQAFEEAEQHQDFHTIVIDTATYLMDMYESVYVFNSADTRKAWGDYAQYWKTLMQQYVAASSKRVVILAHTRDNFNEKEMVRETSIPVKGALQNQGLESYFSCNIATKKMRLEDLEPYQNDLLTITEDDELVGYKHVFQTRLTKDTINERLRAPIGLFSKQETFINNDIQLVLDRLEQFYN